MVLLMLPTLLLLLFVLNFKESLCYTNSTVRLQNSRAINGQAIPLAPGAYLLLLNSYNTVPPEPDEEFPHRIVGGHPITIMESPWQVAIMLNGAFSCGGSIINEHWVLTAAHCLGRGRFYVRAGTRFHRNGGQTRHTQVMVAHPNYNPNTMVNDIAMIKVVNPFRLGSSVRKIKLAQKGKKLPKKFFVSGWGLTDENAFNPPRILRRVEVHLVQHKVCFNDYRGNIFITRAMICAQGPGKDSCSGDSGGPLYWRGVQYGIVSFGNGCARRFYPGVYTDIRKHHGFINSMMKKYDRKPAGGNGNKEEEEEEEEDLEEEDEEREYQTHNNTIF